VHLLFARETASALPMPEAEPVTTAVQPETVLLFKAKPPLVHIIELDHSFAGMKKISKMKSK
jgi:hypothetical protein